LPPEPVFTARAPLVSIVIGTRDRPALLEATLGPIDRQTYPALEVVVVNDAGADVSAVVGRHRATRLLATEHNLGPGGARNVGLRAARGEYVLFFDDDDEMFPDHVAALVDAAERSGLDVAYGQMLNCYLISAGTGRYVLDAIQTYEALLDHADIQWGAQIAVTAVLFRRAIVRAVGEIDETLLTASDYDYWIRLAAEREWARVPYVTSIYNWRSDASNISGRAKAHFHAGHEQIYAKHPTARALVTAGRWEMLDTLARGISEGPRS
jgi:glycosyltransferase involved in cell wall biosynthesis